MSTLRSTWAQLPIDLAEPTTATQWNDAGQMIIPKGFLLAKNDDRFVYLAIDLVEDTTNDPGTGDYFWLSFDRNRNGIINPNIDTNYGVHPGNPNKIAKQFYLGPGSWTGIGTPDANSGCKIAFEASPNSAVAHRVWKIILPISALNSFLFPGIFKIPYTKFGLKVHSTANRFDGETPTGFYRNFKDLHTLYFARKTSIPTTLQGTYIGSVGLIPTTTIAANGRATTAATYNPSVTNAAFGSSLNLMGNRTTIANLIATKAARRHKILTRPAGTSTWIPLLSTWNNYRWNGSTYVLETTTFDSNDTYPLPNPAIDYSIDDLLVQFNSRDFDNGLHEFSIEFYNGLGLKILLPPTNQQVVKLLIDNSVPEVRINSIKHSGVHVDTCAIVRLNAPTDGVVIDYGVNDPEGNLLSYNLTANWGNNQTELIDNLAYNPATMGTSWVGYNSITAPASGVWSPEVSCAHSFTVRANARTTNGYQYIGQNSYSQFITLILP